MWSEFSRTMGLKRMDSAIRVGNSSVGGAPLAELCRRYSGLELSLFGSAARGEDRVESDIDLLVEFLPEAEIDLIDYSGLML
jgi:predicted nucleotidyltransferase